MLKAFIVDDEPLARDELAYLLKRSKQVEIMGEADSIESAMEQLANLDIDVIFLDIQLAGESGMDLAAKMNSLDYPPLIIFATAFDEYALKAFELDAVDYLLKPFDEKRIKQTTEKLYKIIGIEGPKLTMTAGISSKMNDRTEKLAISMDEKIILINTNEILYVGTNEGKTVIAAEKQKYTINEPLINLERRLQHSSFLRVHRAYLVNVNAIIEIEPWFNSTYNLTMIDGEKVPVSRTYTKDLKQLLGF